MRTWTFRRKKTQKGSISLINHTKQKRNILSCRGLKVNYELSLLIENHCPVALCLQETPLKETDKNIKNYIMYNNYAQTDRAYGVSSIDTL